MTCECPPVMRERVAIYSQTQVVDAAGAISTTWAPVSTVWARMKPVSAVQVVLAGRDDAAREFDMTTRYRADITTNSQCQWRGRKFDVHSTVDETERRQYLTVRLREINA